ncbi:MAG: hypothetical protein GTN80_05120, partial [Nitrososphaeria archaeon]|nr:hypothetical protein [Nitrososphaeria archaeon]
GTTTALLWAAVNDESRVDTAVWMEIRSPSKTLSSTGGSNQLPLDIPKYFMIPNNSRWEIDPLDNIQFTEGGMYEIFYFVKDNSTGELSPMKRSVLYKDTPGNTSYPDEFNLVSPADGSEQMTVLLLEWEESADPSGEVTYTVMISEDNTFATVDYIREEIRHNATVIGSEANLSDLTTYYWKVLAIDPYGKKTESNQVWSFNTDNTNPSPPGYIAGWITDRISKRGIGGAVAQRDGTNDKDDARRDGYYIFSTESGNNVSVTASKAGYNSKTKTVNVEALKTKEVNFHLRPIQTTDYYCDTDEDTYISKAVSGTCGGSSCVPGGCTETQGNDCNDGDPAINPGASEICDGKDNDCDGEIPQDEADDDKDTYRICDGDCNDNKSLVNPGVQEGSTGDSTCIDGDDNDCDGAIDGEDPDCQDECGLPHWSDPGLFSNVQMHIAGSLLIDSSPASMCDEVAVFDSGNQLVGFYRVNIEGQYGDLVVYGDATQTPDVDEGAAEGDSLTVRVWDSLTLTEYTGSQVQLLTPASGSGPYTPYQPPFVFVPSQFILMDIEVTQGIDIDLSNDWNFFGWISDIGYYEGTKPQESEYATGCTFTTVDSLVNAFKEMGLSQETYLVVIGPDGKVYAPDSPFNTLESLQCGKAYWIYMNQDVTITLPGSLLSTSSSLQVQHGWGQVGYWGVDELTCEEAFRCIDGYYDVIVNGEGKVYAPGSPFNTLDKIYQVDGYFIHTLGTGALR